MKFIAIFATIFCVSAGFANAASLRFSWTAVTEVLVGGGDLSSLSAEARLLADPSFATGNTVTVDLTIDPDDIRTPSAFFSQTDAVGATLVVTSGTGVKLPLNSTVIAYSLDLATFSQSGVVFRREWNAEVRFFNDHAVMSRNSPVDLSRGFDGLNDALAETGSPFSPGVFDIAAIEGNSITYLTVFRPSGDLEVLHDLPVDGVVPLPAALPLMVSALLGIGLLSRRRRA